MTNVVVLMLLVAAQSPVGPGVGQRVSQEQSLAPTPVTGMFLIPPKIPDCRTKEEVEAALAARKLGDRENCDPERFLKPH